MHYTPKPKWIPAARRPQPGQWVEVKLPSGDVAIARWTEDGWLPFYPAGTPKAWRPRSGTRFRTLPYGAAA